MSGDDKLSKHLEDFRAMVLKRNGEAGFKALRRAFRIYDDNRDHKLNLDEFVTGLEDYQLGMSKEDMIELFSHLDTDMSGTINFDEFIKGVRPPLSKARKNVIAAAFKKMDRTGDGVVTVEDLEKTYDVRQHPKFQSGEMTKKQILLLFLKNFEAEGHVDGRVTSAEFEDYYAGISANFDRDVDFDFQMRRWWSL